MKGEDFASISWLGLQQSLDISAEIRSPLYHEVSKHVSRDMQVVKTGQPKLARYKNKDELPLQLIDEKLQRREINDVPKIHSKSKNKPIQYKSQFIVTSTKTIFLLQPALPT